MLIMRLILGVAFLTTVVYIGFDYAVDANLSFLGFGEDAGSADKQISPLEVLLSAAAMFAGLVFGTLYERLTGTQDQVSIRHEVARVFQSAPLFRALLVSPLVFAGVYALSQSQPDLVVALIFAFQNGFFCEALFRERYAAG